MKAGRWEAGRLFCIKEKMGMSRRTTQIGTFEFPLAVHENDLKQNVLGFVNWH